MRYVFPTAEIPHLWAHQTQSDARNPQGNLFFEGRTIYSYRRSWPLARIYQKKDGTRLVLGNADRCSVTTTGHASKVRRAIPGGWRYIEVPECTHRTLTGRDAGKDEHSQNLAYLEKEMLAACAKAVRRTTERAVRRDAERRNELHKALADYMIFFGVRRKCPALPGLSAAFERARRIENPDPASMEKRERERAKRHAANLARLKGEWEAHCAKVAAWNAGATLTPEEQARHWREHGRFPSDARLGAPFAPWKLEEKCRRAGLEVPHAKGGGYTGPVLLRVDGGQIVTSQGARVPVAAAPVVWAIVQGAMRAGGREFGKGLCERVKIGGYPLDKVDADGTLRAGCHVIPYAELELMARTLGIAETANA